MGLIYTDIRLSNPTGNPERTVEALVDTGSLYTTVPASLLEEIGTERIRQMRFELADGSVVEFEVGTALVAINRYGAVTPVAFGPDDAEPLLGAVALELMELLVDSKNRRLIPTRRGRRHL